MTIAEFAMRGKNLPKEALILGILLISSLLSFGLGVLAGRDLGQEGGGAFSVAAVPMAAATNPSLVATTTMPEGGQVVGSKSGTKYFLPWCGGVAQIKEENKIWFKDREAAEEAGYSPAGNCKGL